MKRVLLKGSCNKKKSSLACFMSKKKKKKKKKCLPASVLHLLERFREDCFSYV